jgi:hypothetical protein
MSLLIHNWLSVQVKKQARDLATSAFVKIKYGFHGNK